jgi:hypothetical protein
MINRSSRSSEVIREVAGDFLSKYKFGIVGFCHLLKLTLYNKYVVRDAKPRKANPNLISL